MNARSKLIFVNRFFYPDHSATAQLLSDLVFFLADNGCDVEVITSAQSYSEKHEYRLPSGECVNGVNVHRVWTTNFGRIFLPGKAIDYMTFYFFSSWRLSRVASRGDTIIVKTDPPLMAIFASKLATWRGATLVNWVQDLFPEVAINLPVRGFNGKFGNWLKKLRNNALSAAAVNIVIGEKMAERLRNEGIPDSAIKVIPNWSPIIEKDPLQEDVDRLRSEWNLDNKFVVGYSGNLGRAHDYRTLLEAILRLKENPDIHFLFVGGGSQMALLQQAVEKGSLKNVSFQPYQSRENLSKSLAVPDLHLAVLRPDMEGLIVPSKVYGIFASGKPTLFVGDENGEIAKILRLTNAGVAVPEGDGEQLASIIVALRHDSARLAMMGENARQAFVQEFSFEHAVGKWSDLLSAINPRRKACLEAK